MRYDLHSHSTCSDGTLAPAALVERAARRGVTMLALTDHDDTRGLAAARTAAREHGLVFIDGVEISVTWCGQTVHVVGLGIDPADATLRCGLAATRSGRVARAERIVAAFDAIGIRGSHEGALEFADNPEMISRTHFARFLVKQGIVKEMKFAFKRFLGGGQICYFPHQWATLADAVNWITGSGGTAVIAHPGRYPFGTGQMRRLLAEFRALGGRAIEVVSSGHKPQQHQTFARYAHEFGLYASSGSDFHSPGESYHDLGSLPALPAQCVPVWQDWEVAA